MTELLPLITYEDVSLGNAPTTHDWWGVAIANTDMWSVVYSADDSLSAFNYASNLLASGTRNIALIVPTPRKIIEGDVS